MSDRSRRARRAAAPATGDSSTHRSTSPSGTPRSGRRERPRARPAGGRSFFERYGGLLLVAFAVVGVGIVALVLLQGSSRSAYACDSLLTPGPSDTIPTPTPAVSASPVAASPFASGASPSATPLPEPTQKLGFPAQDLGRTHILDVNQSVTYDYCPPASGEHLNVSGVAPMQRAFYPDTSQQKPQTWVHNLEHGYVVVAYSCTVGGGCPSQAELDAMRQVFDTAPPSGQAKTCGLPNKVLVLRFDDMSERFALLAWDRVMLMNSFDSQAARTFIQQWQDSPQIPEPGIC